MSNLRWVSRVLRLKDLRVSSFEFEDRDKELRGSVKPYNEGRCCAYCGGRGRIVNNTTHMSCLTSDDLDIPAEIPSQLRTL